MKAAIRQVIKTAFQQLGNLKKQVTYKRLTGETYNNATGKYVNTYSEIPVNVFISYFDKSVVDNLTISLDDRKVYLPAYQINFEPKAGDDSIIIDGQTFAIEAVQNKFGELYVLKI